jgi:orotate phosphoribosyltransferase
MSYKSDFIIFMAQAHVLTFGDFTTKSGRKTPYFINTGKYGNGAQIAKLGGFYADCILENIGKPTDNMVLFGPAYKGIPLAVTTAIALTGHGTNVRYCFNRKEEKDHGEGGSLVGHPLSEGDRVLIVEDVITAGTAVREILPIIQNAGAVAEGLIISVDRMERGTGLKTAVQEIENEFGIRTFPIVTVRDILDCLYNRPVDGQIFIDSTLKARMESYMGEYCI